MISSHDSDNTFEYQNYFKILPQINNWKLDKKRIKDGRKVSDDFSYSSEINREWMSKTDLRKWINANLKYIGNI